MRGKRQRRDRQGGQCRNIPAYAGKTDRGNSNFPRDKEHPRVCGENAGKRLRPALFARNIPAYAGKTFTTRCCLVTETEHPRVCGENAPWCRLHRACSGTSPRMRGKQGIMTPVVMPSRNIPAYAGKTRQIIDFNESETEHPRVCGENRGPPTIRPRPFGTSPRMRGKPQW